MIEQPSAAVPAGTVIAQEPAADAELTGSTMQVLVSASAPPSPPDGGSDGGPDNGNNDNGKGNDKGKGKDGGKKDK